MKLLQRLLLIVIVLVAPRLADACSVCFQDSDSPLAKGAQRGILFMLIVTYVVLFGMAAMFATVVIRARRRQSSQGAGGTGGTGGTGETGGAGVAGTKFTEPGPPNS